MKLRSGVLNEENVIKKNFEANKTIKKKEKVKINSKSKNSGKVDKSVAAPSKVIFFIIFKIMKSIIV